MSSGLLKVSVAASLTALALAGCASNAATGAAGGAVAGAVVGGPVGAAVGGVAGAAIGSLTPEETGRVREYVVTQRRPSVRVRDEVVVGYRVPPRAVLYPLPPEVGVRTSYEYTIINNRRVLVDPSTREVVEVFD